VHFGTGTGIPDREFKAIESAGVPHFKDADWTGGVLAILDRADSAVGTAAPARGAPLQTSRGPSSSSGFGFGGVFLFLVIGGGVLFVIWLVARRRSAPVYGPTVVGGYGPPVGGGGYGPPVVGGYGPGVGPSYGGGGSGIGTNIAAAGIGGLIGYELGKEVAGGHHHHRYDDGDGPPPGYEPEGPYEAPDRGAEGEPGNYDAGGASGGWDDSSGGGDSGGGDSGGGGGDADF
jgi:hypothetical protein